MRHCFTQCRESAAPGREINSHVETVAAVPIGTRVAVGQYIDFGADGNSQHGYERRQRRRTRAGDGLLICSDQGALVQRHPLRAEEQLGGAQDQGIFTAIEHVTHDEMDALVEKKLWRRAAPAADEVEIRRLQRVVAQKMIPESDHQLPILPRVAVRNGGDLLGGNALAWRFKQCLIKPALRGAGFRRGSELGARQIGLEQIVRNQQTAARIAVRQEVPAGEPEILHPGSPYFGSARASVASSTISPGSSSPSVSRNAKARRGFGPRRGRSVRKISRMVPSSSLRCIAMRMSAGW